MNVGYAVMYFGYVYVFSLSLLSELFCLHVCPSVCLALYWFMQHFIVFVYPKSADHKKEIWSLLGICLLLV